MNDLEKCKNDPYYFYKEYCLINGDSPNISRNQFYMAWNSVYGATNSYPVKAGRGKGVITVTPSGINDWYNIWERHIIDEKIKEIIK